MGITKNDVAKLMWSLNKDLRYKKRYRYDRVYYRGTSKVEVKALKAGYLASLSLNVAYDYDTDKGYLPDRVEYVRNLTGDYVWVGKYSSDMVLKSEVIMSFVKRYIFEGMSIRSVKMDLMWIKGAKKYRIRRLEVLIY